MDVDKDIIKGEIESEFKIEKGAALEVITKTFDKPIDNARDFLNKVHGHDEGEEVHPPL